MKTRISLRLLALVIPLIGIGVAVALLLPSRVFTSPAKAQGVSPYIQLDMNPTNGSGPCNPVDDTVTVTQGNDYDVAICLTDSDSPPNAFEVHIDNNDGIDHCIPVDCGDSFCLDGNPDTNAGSTTFSSPDLGAGWDCNVAAVLPATCSDNANEISLTCIDANNRGTLPFGAGVSVPVGMIHFMAASQGTDQLKIRLSTAARYDGTDMFTCDQDSNPCKGGTVVVSAPGPASPTPQPTGAPGVTVSPPAPADATAAAAAIAAAATTTSAAAATAIAQGTPAASINATSTAASAATKAAATSVATSKATAQATAQATATVKPSGTSQNASGGSSGTNVGLIVGIIVVVLIVVGGGGWFGYRRWRARKA